MKGYYGKEDAFNPNMHNKSNSSGRYDSSDNSCPYVMNGDSVGTVYVVSGSAGRLEGSIEGFPHKAFYYSNIKEGGSMAIEVKNNRLDARWINTDGDIKDQFTLLKNVNNTTIVPLVSGQKCTLNASWEGKFNWNTGETDVKSITVAPATTTTYTVKDGLGCVKDVFVVEVK